MQSVQLPDFDTLRGLAEHDPAALEALRLRLVEELIRSAPIHLQPRLRGLQFQIDSQRQLARTPMAACLRLSAMMHQSFTQLRIHLNRLAGKDAPHTGRATKTKIDTTPISATIIPFRQKQAL